MHMLICTKVLRPGAPRIAKLTRNIVLPRTVPLPSLLGAAAGAVLFVPLAVPLGWVGVHGSAAVVAVMASGAAAGVMLVAWQPWQGENVGKVVWVRAGSTWKSRKSPCPGSGRVAGYDTEIETDVCPVCGVAGESSADGLVGNHLWDRRLFVGMAEVRSDTGVVVIRSGSVPVR